MKLKAKSCFYLWFILILAGGTLGGGFLAHSAPGRDWGEENELPSSGFDVVRPLAGNQSLKRSTIKVAVLGGSVALGTLVKLDVFHDCFQYETTKVNRVRETQTWWSILERILSDWVEGGVEVINTGVGGNTAADGVTRLQDSVLSHAPDYVLVMFGMEDVFAGVRGKIFRESLEKILNRIQERDAKPVLVTPTPVSERMAAKEYTIHEVRQVQAHLSNLAQTVRSLAREKSLPLIDLHQYFLDNRLAYDHLFEGYLPDGVAQSAMASFVAGELLPIMGLKKFPKPVLCDYRKVYSDAEHPETKHNAFTDLAYFKGEFFIAFRKGHAHGVPHQTNPQSDTIVVLRSPDAVTWTEEAVLKKEGRDNRDPKFLQVSERFLVYTPCARTSDRSEQPRIITYGFERLSPGRWSKPFACAPCVFWRPRKWGAQYVVAAYSWEKKDAAVKLLSSKDGCTWKIVSDILPFETNGNETDLLVSNDELSAFSRAGSGLDMLISTCLHSENRWKTVSSGRIIHAPNVFKAGGRVMICGRYCSHSDERFRELQKDWRRFTSGNTIEAEMVDPARVEEYHHGLRTGIFLMDGTRPRLVMELLSAGDSSYTGVVRYGDEFVISDYSMHEYYRPILHPGDWNTPSDIYVWRIRFGE